MARKIKLTPDRNRSPEINQNRGERTHNPALAAAFEDYGCPLIKNFGKAYWASPYTPKENLEMVCDKIKCGLVLTKGFEWVLHTNFLYSAGRVN